MTPKQKRSLYFVFFFSLCLLIGVPFYSADGLQDLGRVARFHKTIATGSDLYNHETYELVDHQEEPKDSFIHGPCPVSRTTQSESIERGLAFSFEPEANRRLWSSIVESLEGDVKLYGFQTRLRSFVVMWEKLMHPSSFVLGGASVTGDLLYFAQIAICDEIGILHHHIKDGINPIISSDSSHQTLVLREKDHIILDTFYRACRMTVQNAHRYGPALYTRVGFFPTASERDIIRKALDIKMDRPHDMLCTYKKRS
jgi:hypothetical protein